MKVQRAIWKALTWNMLATIMTAGVVWAATKSHELSFSVAVADRAMKFLIYYIHEKVWELV